MKNALRLAAAASVLVASIAPATPAVAQSALDPYIGQLAWVSFNFCPRGWAQANGQLLPIAQNQALFSLLGTQFGGNGQTNFALPNLQGRIIVGQGTGPGLATVQIGESSGSTTKTLTPANMPQHSHGVTAGLTLNATSAQGSSAAPAGNALADGRTARLYRQGLATTDMDASAISVSGATQIAGGSQPVDAMAPYQTLNACIALQGAFPSRN
jgi:microcystin-dependent protein